jgi:cation diffusion facilitator CzcD-associated flavoprotein CzcO
MKFAERADELSATNANAEEGPRERFDVVVIGAGQAGLAIGNFLARSGRRFLILDGADSIAAAWRSRWPPAVRSASPTAASSMSMPSSGRPATARITPGSSFPSRIRTDVSVTAEA